MLDRDERECMWNDDVIDFGGIPLLAAADIMEMGGTEMGVAWGKDESLE